MNATRLLTASVCVLLFAARATAQVANDNPTGDGGDFGGVISDGGHVVPVTGTAKRSVTDIVVAGAVGAPLQLTRTSSSRYTAGVTSDFGGGGGWMRSYDWTIDTIYTGGGAPQRFSANYPDGRTIIFKTSSLETDPSYFRGPRGTSDRLRWIKDSSTSGRCWLLLPDGGKVYFTATINNAGNGKIYTFTLQNITDPYGQVTTITGARGSWMRITEPAGRWLQLEYDAAWLVQRVRASDGRTVQYSYTNGLLSRVDYWDSGLSANYTYDSSVTGGDGPPLATCDDPMYPGMRRIAYVYASGTNADGTKVVPGQIKSENYWDGTFNAAGKPNIGTSVMTLDVTGKDTRKETRGDGKTRTFTYTKTLLTNWTDFKNVAASQTQDAATGFLTSRTDRKGNTTTYSTNSLTGAIQQITYPATPSDAPAGNGTMKYLYVATCSGQLDSDPNNCDANNPYWLHSTTDEAGNTTIYMRDANHRVAEIRYPDGGTESFTYNNRGQVVTHRMRTGGLEKWEYDARGLLTKYRDPYHLDVVDSQNPSVPTSSTPSMWYGYDALDRVRAITDALGTGLDDPNHTTSFSYNTRGQITDTVHPADPGSIGATVGQRYKTTNDYNLIDGTRRSFTDELGHTTFYTYDAYRRVRTITTPGHNTPLKSTFCYNSSNTCTDQPTSDDYTHTDSNVTLVVSPTGKTVKTVYDENKRKLSITAAFGAPDVATTSYGYDNNGNVTSVVSPNEQPGQLYAGKTTAVAYDERNRIKQITDALNNPTTLTYDSGGRQAKIARANGQQTTFDSYDNLNRLLQQTAQQAPNPNAVTKYTYYTSGLVHTMLDPHNTNNGDAYVYEYDLLGRQTRLTYPADEQGVHSTEQWQYDDPKGRLHHFTNRMGAVQTINWDALDRQYNFTWANDPANTPGVNFGYDLANRLRSIDNGVAPVSRQYYYDNLLQSETTSIVGEYIGRSVDYSYDADSNRQTIQYPNGSYSFSYDYTGRNQLQNVYPGSSTSPVASYLYDKDGNLTRRSLENSTSSTFQYDALDRAYHIAHAFTQGDTRTLDYGYDVVSNRQWQKRDGGNGDTFGYDLNDQVKAALIDVAGPDTSTKISQANDNTNPPIKYDANGNRTEFRHLDTNVLDTYSTNNLNEYTSRQADQGPIVNATYNANGDMTTSVDGSTYTYDAQNRLLTATKNGSTETFKYDGLNRQVSRKIGTATPTYNVYDGWNLIAEYNPGATSPLNAYVYGAGGLVKLIGVSSSSYYYQDASGSTSHLADSSGQLVQWLRYELHGTPIAFLPNNSSDARGPLVRHLFTGQQWYSDVALYDLRNRFYSPDTGRFLQPDPIKFYGDRTNLYRYCRNNSLKWSDPLGLIDTGAGQTQLVDGQHTTGEVVVNGQWPAGPGAGDRPTGGTGDTGGGLGGGGGGGEGGGAETIGWIGDKAWVDNGDQYNQMTANPDGSTDRATVALSGGNGYGNPGDSAQGGGGGGVGGDGGGGGAGEAGLGGGPGGRGAATPGGTVGDLYDYKWLRKQLYRYGVEHRAELQSEYQFISGIYYGASAYSLIGLGGLGAGDLLAGTSIASAPPNARLIYPYARFIFQMIAKNRGPQPPARWPPPPPPYVSGP